MDMKPGDVVILKSGGEPMTVTDIKNETATCVWMGEEGDLFRETLPLVALDPIAAWALDEDEDEDENGDADGDDENEEDEDEDEDEDEEEDEDDERAKARSKKHK